MKPERNIEFLFEVGSLFNVQRGWRQHLGMDCATIPEHSFRVVWLALLLARKEGIKDEEKVMKMALVHDLAETRTSDFSYVQKVYVTADEDRASRDLLADTIWEDFYKGVLAEYELRQSPEAKVVKDADNLDIDLELKEFEERGSPLPKKWQGFRQKVRDEKLYTKSAKELWDLIQTSKVEAWHMTINKWVKLPQAGK
ncbi:MAG: HD domain-containing protein [Patescibacteria group bacterium]